MEEHTQSRRSALRTLGWLVAGTAGLWRFLTPRGLGARGRERAVVDSAAIPAGGALVLPAQGIAIAREGATVLALDLACTHLGCSVSANANGFACPCHGSRFDCGGKRLAGPATDGLRRLHVDESGGIVRVTEVAELAEGGLFEEPRRA
ncbi:MAG: ubiquinol-cytochrome c reductase iron-sulfur subunit [Thermoanaerobaculia bacterium]